MSEKTYKRGDLVRVPFGGRSTQVAVYLCAGRTLHSVLPWKATAGEFGPKRSVRASVLEDGQHDPRSMSARAAWAHLVATAQVTE